MKLTVPDLADVLAEVNRLRGERGLEPLSEMPKGKRNSKRGCLIARALAGEVVPGPVLGGERYFNGKPLTPLLSEASHAFDQCRYPELVER